MIWKGVPSLVVALSLGILGACSTVKKSEPPPTSVEAPTPSEGKRDQLGPPEPFGPMPIQTPASVYGPEPFQTRPLVLVLGPGLARSFAYAGVLRALEEAKLPIGAIVATEMGALIAILYSLNDTINKFDWSLERFKEDLFLEGPPLFSSLLKKKPGNGNKLEETLERVLGKKKIEKGRVLVQIVIQKLKSGEVVLVKQGEAASIARAAVPVRMMMSPGKLDSDFSLSSDEVRPFAVSEARFLGLGPVVVIDVLESGANSKSSSQGDQAEVTRLMSQAEVKGGQEFSDAALVLRPDLTGIGYFDFKKRSEAIFKGKTEVMAHLKELRQLVGLPPEIEGGVP